MVRLNFSKSKIILLAATLTLSSFQIFAAEQHGVVKAHVRVNHKNVEAVQSNFCKISMVVSAKVTGTGAFSLVKSGVCKVLDADGQIQKKDVVAKEFDPELTSAQSVDLEYQYLNDLSEHLDYFVKPVCHIISSENRHCIVMEHGGETLSDLMRQRQNKVFDDAFVRETGRRLSTVLDFVHKKYLLVHRDIKPDNILFDNGVFKIIDLGLMVPVGTEAKAGGSPFYVPNESYENGKATGKMDVFSLGVMLYRMKFGSYPQELIGKRSFEFDMQVMAFQYSKFNNLLDGAIAKEDDPMVSVILRMIRPFCEERPEMAEVKELFESLK